MLPQTRFCASVARDGYVSVRRTACAIECSILLIGAHFVSVWSTLVCVHRVTAFFRVAQSTAVQSSVRGEGGAAV